LRPRADDYKQEDFAYSSRLNLTKKENTIKKRPVENDGLFLFVIPRLSYFFLAGAAGLLGAAGFGMGFAVFLSAIFCHLLGYLVRCKLQLSLLFPLRLFSKHKML
jgi:hypothetical protein